MTGLRGIRVTSFWLLLVILAAFVVFVECLADVGGSREALPVPAPTEPSPGARSSGAGLGLKLED
jgi:hypothetical protein